jgi:hypothetical protein
MNQALPDQRGPRQLQHPLVRASLVITTSNTLVVNLNIETSTAMQRLSNELSKETYWLGTVMDL